MFQPSLKWAPGSKQFARELFSSESQVDLFDLLKSMMGFSRGMSLFDAEQVKNILTPGKDRSGPAFETVARATREQLGSAARGVFETADRLQRSFVDGVLGRFSPEAAGAGERAASTGGKGETGTGGAAGPFGGSGRVRSGRLDVSTFVAIGEGLAAGMGNFTLYEAAQRKSFPAQMARQMQAEFPQPLIQAPGIGHAVGFPELPVRVPGYLQTTVLEQLRPWFTGATPGRRRAT